MKKYFGRLGVLIVLLATVGFAHCSERAFNLMPDGGVDSLETISFEAYSEGRESLGVVLGCGQKHREKTCAGFDHNHEGAYTIDLQQRNRWEVSKPHRYGDVFKEETWEGIPSKCLDDITLEHIVLFSQLDLRAVRKLMGEGLEIHKAKEKAGYVAFDCLVDHAVEHLKPGGTLTILPAFHPHGAADFCCKGIFQSLLSCTSAVFVDESEGRLLEEIFETFPFDRGFPHMEIRFYKALGRKSSERTSTFVSEYVLNMSSKAEEENTCKNKELARLICKERELINYVTLVLVKEGE